MPGFKRPPLAPGALSDLVDALHELHLQAGQPSARVLRHDIGGAGVASHTSIHKLFTQPRVPTWGLLELVVEAMARRAGLDEKRQVERFRDLRAQAARSGNTAMAPDATASPPAVTSGPDAQEAMEPLSRPLLELLPSALDELEAIGTPGQTDWPAGLRRRIRTGFADLDALLGGWSPGCLVIVGGQPSSGKTTLLLNFCRAAAVKYAIPTMLISGEMNSTELQTRILSAEGRVPLHNMRTGQMGDEDWTRLARALSAIAKVPLHIGTPSRFRIDQLRADTTRLAKDSGLELLVIDSLQWITAHADSAGQTAEVALWQLKDLAVTLNIPIIVSAQAESHKGLAAMKYLRDSSAIERVADVLLILHRPDQDNREDPRAGETDLIVAKNRNGPTAVVTVAHQHHYCRLVDMMPSRVDLAELAGSTDLAELPDSAGLAERPGSADLAERPDGAHDRSLYQRLLKQIPPDGQVIDWLKNDFMLKAFPARHFKSIEQTARMFSLESIAFDDEDVNQRYKDLRDAVDDFCKKISHYTWEDPGGNWLEVPTSWRDNDRGKYDRTLTAIGYVRDILVKTYDNFLRTCHDKGIDREVAPEV